MVHKIKKGNYVYILKLGEYESLVKKVTVYPSITNAGLASLVGISEHFSLPYDLDTIDLEILQFFALNGPNPCLSLTKGPIIPRKRGRPPEKKWDKEARRDKEKILPYDYKRILRRVKKLEEMNLLQRIRPKRKKLFALAYEGFHIIMQTPNKTQENIGIIIKKNHRLLPFSQSWSELIGIAGKQFVHECLTKTISEKIYRYGLRIEDLKCSIYLYFVYPSPVFQIKDDEKNKQILKLISSTVKLKKCYIQYLSTNDIFNIIKNKKWPRFKKDFHAILDNLECIKALEFFNGRKIDEKPISIYTTLIYRVFGRYNSPRFFFTGLFIDKLLQN